jgi:phenylacetate-coenzyme A ligase PaaK-like adenylate-forming protein
MFESTIRANIGRLHKVYDSMPYPLQNFLTSARGLVLARSRYSHGAERLRRSLRVHEEWSAADIVEFQRRALERIVSHARRTVPFYADYPNVEWRTSDDIRNYPVLPREVVRNDPQRFVSRAVDSSHCVRVGTTGTTGASLRVTYTEEVARRNWAFHMRRWAWAGVKPRTPRVTFFGSRVIPADRRLPPFWTHNVFEQQTLASIFHLSESNAPHYIDFLRKNTGKVLEGFPSVLAILADFILKTGSPVPMRVVFTDGEPLYPLLRESIERAFSTRVFDLYGNTELCGLIHECEDGRMHAAPDYAYLEILDELDRPVEPGVEGFLVWTGFINDTMPLIRYRIGDRGCWDAGPTCSCGRHFPVVVPTITRESDVLRCPDGRIFSPRALNQALKGAKTLRFCQILHEQPGQVLVRGVASHPSAYEDVMTIRKNLQAILGNNMSVSATLADSPIVRPGGKIPLIIQPNTPEPAAPPPVHMTPEAPSALA